MSCIGLDVAPRTTGWGYKGAFGKWRFGAINSADQCAILTLLNQAKNDGVTAAVIETWPPLPNPNTRMMFRSQGGLIALCEMAQIHWELMHVSTWRSILGWPRMSTQLAKSAAKKLAEKLVQVPVKSNDAADAVCIAEAWMRRHLSGYQDELELRGPRGGKTKWKGVKK